jgi:sugar transferase (PEP-CTERM system associated)
MFSPYFPTRRVLLLVGEIIATCSSFALAIVICGGEEARALLSNHQVGLKILAVAVLAFLCAHFLELHDLGRLVGRYDIYARILMLVGMLSFVLAALSYVFPHFKVARFVFLTGLFILAAAWSMWRWTYARLIAMPILREKVYLIGNGERGIRIREAIETRAELGMDLVGWWGLCNKGISNNELVAEALNDLANRHAVDRVIVALADRRSTMPVNELLNLRLQGVQVEDGTSLLEKLTGKIDVDELHPSWMIFGNGFRLTKRHWFSRRILSTLMAFTLSILTLPLIPFIALIIAYTSPGPLLYRQKRVGLQGRVFECLKFRTMKADAEADTGATWASDDDPRITAAGRMLRRWRLDEIPQIWNVLRGDMAFVGPRPERPEFVTKLSGQIPYYNIRHALRPGITGWAQINYGYGSSVEEAKEKLRFDLFYIRNVYVTLDLLIVFNTVRAVVRGRGVR